MRLGKFSQDADGNFHGTLKAYGLPETPVIPPAPRGFGATRYTTSDWSKYGPSA